MARKSNNRSAKRRSSGADQGSEEISMMPEELGEGRRSRSSRREFDRGERDYKDILQELLSNPALKYVAAGLATAVLTRIANKMSDRYPEISSFIRENLDQIEGRFGDFSGEGRGESARH